MEERPFIRLCVTAAGAVAMMLAALVASAQEASALQVDLNTTTVVAAPVSSPLTVSTKPKTPRQPLPASDGSDYLRTIPGFSAIRNGGTNSDPVLRGMFGSRLNILTNGIPMQGACGARMDSPTSYISPESYDKVTVVKGPETVIHGPVGSAGTALFERNTERFTEPGSRLDSSVVAGSSGRNDQNVDFTAGNSNAYARVITNHAHSQDYQDGRGQAVPSQWDKWNVDTVFGLTPDDHTRLELTAGTGDGYARYAGRPMDGTHFRRESLGLRFDRTHISGLFKELEAQAYYNDTDHVMDNFTLRTPAVNSGMPMAMASNVNRRTVGGRFAATLTLTDSLQLVTGLDMQFGRVRLRNGSDVVSYTTQAWQPSTTFSDVGAFGELTWFATEQGSVITGAHLDRVGVRDNRPTIGGAVNPTAGAERKGTLPSGFARYEHTFAGIPASFYAGVGHTERFPDYWELISPRRGPEGAVNAFASVQPEKTTQVDVGAQYKGQHSDAWISAYAGSINNFILFNYVPGMMGPLSQVTNVNANIAGGEVGGTWRPNGPWRFEGSLAYAWGRNRATGAPLPQMPPLEARLGVEYAKGPWSAGALWRVAAAQHRHAKDQGNVVGMDFGPSAGFGAFSVHGGYALNKTASVTVGIDNVFNKAYTEHLNRAGDAGFGFAADTQLMEPGRTVWVRLNVKL